MLQPNFYFLFFQTNYFEIDPLDWSLNAQSGCVMVSFGLFIKRMSELKLIELFVFTFYRWSILKWMLQPNFYFLFFRTNYFAIDPLDWSLNAQSWLNCSCSLFTDDLFWNECYNQTFIFLFFQTNYFAIVHWTVHWTVHWMPKVDYL